MKATLLSLGLFVICLNASAQLTYHQSSIQSEKIGEVNAAAIREDWMPVLFNEQMPSPNGNSEREYLMKLKEELKDKYPYKPGKAPVLSRDEAPLLTVLRNFDGNGFTNSPNDNEVAISNDGKLISVVNTTIYMFDVVKDTLLKNISLTSFNQTGSTGRICYDPKVYYDPENDRFILFWLFGSGTPNEIHLAFSQTNDPLGNWNYYKINGDPNSTGTWSDYPMVAATEKELFLTVNSVLGGDWKSGFKGSLIYQIDKQSGYSGQPTLTAQMMDSISFNGSLIRNICPVKGGSRSYGPNLYFLSNMNFAVSSDTVFLMEITDTLNAPARELKMTVLKTPVAYFLSPTGRQKTGKAFDTNDSRVLGAFLENDKIQYVHNSRDTSTGFGGVYHGVISDITTTPVITGYIIGDTARDFGYPNISYAGNAADDHSAIINFNHTGSTVFAGNSSVLYSEGVHYPAISVKEGTGSVSISVLTPLERWGDYSGSQRKYNEPGKVWVTGYYADSLKRNRTWVAELSAFPATGIKPSATRLNSLVYPNPTQDLFEIKFSLSEPEYLTFGIYNLKGELVKDILRDYCKAGVNNFTFSTKALPAGIYQLKIEGEQNRFSHTAKIVKQ